MRELGEGGFGTAYLAVDTESNERVVVKILKKDDKKYVKTFHAETFAA